MKNLFINVLSFLNISKFKNLFAFTLAEVVLVIGIIGIIGVLGVTNAKKDTDTSEKIAQLKKTYEILDTAFTQAVMENGNINQWEENINNIDSHTIWKMVTPYLKLTKNCDDSSGCWKDSNVMLIKDKKETTLNFESDDCARGILANGASIAVKYPIGNIFSLLNFDGGGGSDSIVVFVDVNGKKGLNMLGNDVFAFWIMFPTDPEQTSSLMPITPAGENFSGKLIDYNDIYKTAWVLKYGNMDYLKPCGDTLNWDGPHTCK